MTRGKHSSATGGRLAADLAAARDKARALEIEVRALTAALEKSREAEAELHGRLAARRAQEVVVGTYTEADRAALEAEMRRDFHDRALEARAYLRARGAIDNLNGEELREMSRLFDVKPGELMSSTRRRARRFTTRDVGLAEQGYARRNLGKGL